MFTKRRLFVLAAVVLFLLFLLMGQAYNQRRPNVAVAEWQRRIQAARLIGKTPDEVIAFLSAEQLETGTYDVTHRNNRVGGVIYADTGIIARTFSLSDGPVSMEC